ncbi:MAG: hypothetical protein GY939_03210 [Actinomycetia bacterium]|nr:hypothetical protein [Actinomycetes bacterium]
MASVNQVDERRRHEDDRTVGWDELGELKDRGATGIVAGCTEIELLVGADDVDMAYFPTTRIHAEAVVAAALA